VSVLGFSLARPQALGTMTSNLHIRVATPEDSAHLAALNRAAYPDLVEDGVVFDESQLLGHTTVFPRGQLVAELDGKIAGAIATMIVPRAIDALAPHTWMGVTDGGTFVRHDPEGDTLYLADVYVAESAWGRGVGRALYEALFALCRELRLKRVVAGGRLYDYDAYADKMTPHAYIDAVVRGELKDRVLISQLRAGFTVRGVLASYLHDWRSRHYASLLVWENPLPPAAETDAPRSRTAPVVALS
jgi:GNAT superfamily N-acetyltransferase